MQGIAKIRADGVYKDRKPVIHRATVRELQAAGLGPTEIAQKPGIGRACIG